MGNRFRSITIPRVRYRIEKTRRSSEKFSNEAAGLSAVIRESPRTGPTDRDAILKQESLRRTARAVEFSIRSIGGH